MPVGSVNEVKLNPDNTVDVAFDVNKRYQLYTSTRAVVRYENLVGDRYLEITSGPGESAQAARRVRTIAKENTQPALDLDALLGGLRPVLKGLDGNKVNEVSNAVIELLQGQGGALSTLLSSTASFTQNLAARDQLIGDVINNLNTVLGTVDEKGAQFDASVDQLQQLITGLAQKAAIRSRAPSRRWRRPTNDLTDMLQTVAAAAAGRDREPPPARAADGRAQGATSTRSSSRSPRTTCGSTHLAPTARSSTSTTARSGSRSTARRAATS